MNYIVKRQCFKCAGLGVWEGIDPCPTCDGAGIVTLPEGARGSLLQFIALPDNVFHSHEILEAIDTTEYNALTDTQKDGVKTLLSCSLVDLNVGKAGRVRLVAWFGEQSTTVANLTALLV